MKTFLISVIIFAYYSVIVLIFPYLVALFNKHANAENKMMNEVDQFLFFAFSPILVPLLIMLAIFKNYYKWLVKIRGKLIKAFYLTLQRRSQEKMNSELNAMLKNPFRRK